MGTEDSLVGGKVVWPTSYLCLVPGLRTQGTEQIGVGVMVQIRTLLETRQEIRLLCLRVFVILEGKL